MWVARFSIFGCPDTPRMCSRVWVPHDSLGWPSFIWHLPVLPPFEGQSQHHLMSHGSSSIAFSLARDWSFKGGGLHLSLGPRWTFGAGWECVGVGAWIVDSGMHLDVNYSLWPYNPTVSRQKKGVAWLVIDEAQLTFTWAPSLAPLSSLSSLCPPICLLTKWSFSLGIIHQSFLPSRPK